jgi:hypothetical protein
MLRFRAMRHGVSGAVLFLLLSNVVVFGTERGELLERRQRAVVMFRDGILLVHANSTLGATADGFRQTPAFYYFTDLANTSSALLAIDGRSGQP